MLGLFAGLLHELIRLDQLQSGKTRFRRFHIVLTPASGNCGSFFSQYGMGGPLFGEDLGAEFFQLGEIEFGRAVGGF